MNRTRVESMRKEEARQTEDMAESMASLTVTRLYFAREQKA